MAECCIPFWFTLTLTSGLISSLFFVSGKNNFPQMCFMLDQFLGGICHVTVTFLVSFAFSKIELLFVTPSFRNSCFFLN